MVPFLYSDHWLLLSASTFANYCHFLNVTIEDANVVPQSLWPYDHVLHQKENNVVNTASSGLLPCMSSEPLRKSTHFLHQYMSPFAMLTFVLFYKEGLYISTQHRTKHWRGSPFTGLPHHHLVRVEIITSMLAHSSTPLYLSIFCCHRTHATCIFCQNNSIILWFIVAFIWFLHHWIRHLLFVIPI
jgi:hypothetical protein